MPLQFATSLLLMFVSLPSVGQKVSCSCDSVNVQDFQLDCKKISLSGGSSLQYQFNCDSIWLTLCSSSGKKHILYSIETRLHHYHDRVGYVFYKEFRKELLFRKDCVIPTGCNFFLVDKNSGRMIEEFGDLIDCPGLETLQGFLVYLDNSFYQN